MSIMESALVPIICVLLMLRPSTQFLYVQPHDLPPPDCPGQPCFTLDHYIHNADEYFTTGAKFIFLNGQHTLQGTVNLTSISNITLTKEDHTEVRLTCRSEGALAFENTSNVTIEGLMFISQLNRRSIASLFSFVSSREIRLLNITFQGNQQFQAINSSGSSITIVNCHFEGNNIGDNGGALCAENSDITLKRSIFIQNKATHNGGAIYALKSSINILKENSTYQSQENDTELNDDPLATIFLANDAFRGGAIFLKNSILLMSGTRVIFANNSAHGNAGAIWCEDSQINSTVKNLHFLNNIAKKGTGGATFMLSSSLYLGSKVPHIPSFPGEVSNASINLDCEISPEEVKVDTTTIFSRNHAKVNGGAIGLFNATAAVGGTSLIFDNNSANNSGGALSLIASAVASNTEHLYFNNNTAIEGGGAIAAVGSSLILGDTYKTSHYFINNSCGKSGGAIFHAYGLLAILGNSYFIENRAINLTGGAIHKDSNQFLLSCRAFFINNHSKRGGAIFFDNIETNAIFHGELVEFRNNSAGGTGVCFVNGRVCAGGAVAISNSTITLQVKELYFNGNFAVDAGGALYIVASILTIFKSASFIQNVAKIGGVMDIESESAVTINGKATFDQNSAKRGGAVCATKSFLILTEYANFSCNKVSDVGGAIFGYNRAEFNFNGLTIFNNNTAGGNGGGIYALDTRIIFTHTVEFTSNSAQNGGAMFFDNKVILTIQSGTNLTTAYNHAAEYGGVIYHEDSGATILQCDKNKAIENLYQDFFLSFSYCFIRLRGYPPSFNVESHYDSADKDGIYIYGGFMDKCQLFSIDLSETITFLEHLQQLLQIIPSNNTKNAISSKPYQLCFCHNDSYIDCFGKYRVEAYRGQRFNVSLVAIAQGDRFITSEVTVQFNSTARLNINQSSQIVAENCSVTAYNVYSTEEHEILVVYPTNGPCIDSGLSKAVIEVTLLPCPEGFNQSSEQCVCEERLQAYDAECIIDEMVLVNKRSINFWMSTLYVNESYQGLILYKICPVEYCKSGNVSMTLNDLDIQCDFNRSGMLCGACATNYSLLLGSSTCEICSNAYISLLVPFAFAGLSLVSFLTFLRLTVATGMINSLILYANIVQANKNLFFPPNTRNLLTVFIAWLNLDLGFKTCFYDGMDGYAQTWLQFAFPLYVWILISLIIISSRYSIKVSRLIGSNPIAVLATLLLLSYTKILKIIIEVFSSVQLDYPNDKKVTVWLKDANVLYMEHKHIILTVVTLCIVLFFFFPYTLLLLLGYKLYSFRCCRKYFHCWLIRLRSLLDSYYAPYNIHHQYWTGLMLLVRCVLYLVFSYNSLGETNGSLLAIIVAFVLVGFYFGFLKVYKKLFNNVIEIVTYLNLILLSSVTLADIHTPALVYTSVGITFIIFKLACVYHLYIFYIPKRYLNFSAKIIKRLKNAKTSKTPDRPLLVIKEATPPTNTVIEVIREPLLETD